MKVNDQLEVKRGGLKMLKNIQKQIKRGAQVYTNNDNTEFSVHLKQGHMPLFKTIREARDFGFGNNSVFEIEVHNVFTKKNDTFYFAYCDASVLDNVVLH